MKHDHEIIPTNFRNLIMNQPEGKKYELKKQNNSIDL